MREHHVIHRIQNLEQFYEIFGFTHALRQLGIVPEEFIWDKYVNAKTKALNFDICMQIHLIEYLEKYSETFMKKYGNQYKAWKAAHLLAARSAEGTACISCKLKCIQEF